MFLALRRKGAKYFVNAHVFVSLVNNATWALVEHKN